MSKPGGTSDQILNLPTGGGAVSGTGSSFDVDLNTGTASATLGLVLPTGRNGIKPTITLRYHSGAGDGPFGMGWTLGLLTITRKLDPAPRRFRGEAVGAYTLVGVGDLVAMADGRYRPAVETVRQLIRRAGAAWTITDRADTTHTLGATPAGRITADDGGAVAWLIERTADSLGNAITHSWLADGNARLPQGVAWGTYRLDFIYEPRPDRVSDGRYGPLVVTARRCSRIELHVTTEAASLVRSWSFDYDDGGGAGRSLLARLHERGHAADGTAIEAPVRGFTYSTIGPPVLRPVEGFLAPMSNPDNDLVDLDGDGLPDLLVLGAGRPVMHPNLGDLHFGPPRPLSQLPAPVRLSARGVAFADMDGDGSADLLVLDRPLSGYYPLEAPPGGSGPTHFGPMRRFAHAPRVAPADPSVRLLDLNQDAVTDVLVDTGRTWLEWLRNQDGGFIESPRLLPSALRPPVHLADPRTYLADMNGDGLTDIVRVDGGGVTYWPGRADGGWGDPVRMTPAPALPRDHMPMRLALVDIDGDGCADLVYVGPSSVTFWRNVGADRLAAPVTVANTPPARPGTYRFADLLGNGTPGILFDLPATRPGGVRQAFLDLTGGRKPYLLTGIDNGHGLTTTLTYRSSTAFACDDAAAGTPWRTYHPFPMQCIARVDVADAASGVVKSTVYRYHEARFDPDARAFLGFGRVETDSLGDVTAPTLRTETVFHLGLDPADPARPLTGDEALRLGALRRRVLSTTVWGLDVSPDADRPYSVVRHTYSTNLVPSGTGDGAQVSVPFLASTTEDRWERQPRPISARQTEFLEVTPDGDITLQRTRATRAGAATPDQDVTTRFTFATGGTNLHLLARMVQTGPDGAIIASNVTFYDGPAHVGLPEGQATQGFVTRIEDLALTDDLVQAIWGQQPPDLTPYGYHRLPGDPTGWWITRRSHARTTSPDGPVLVSRGPLGAETRLQLDRAGQRIVRITDALGNVSHATIDPRTTQTQSVTDVNGNVSRDAFDALGRVTETFAPGDPAGRPTATFAYTPGTVSRVDAYRRPVPSGPADDRGITWFDASGNVLGEGRPAAQAGHFVITGATRSNARGLRVASYLPYVVAGDAWQAPPPGTPARTQAYDALGRLAVQSDPRGFTVRIRRDGATLTISEQRGAGAPADVERHIFDAAGQLVSVARNAAGRWVEQTYAYHPLGALAQVTLPGGPCVTFRHDLLGRRIAHRSPDTGQTIYLLDAMGNERLRVLATGQKVRTDVDALNRLIAITHDNEAVPRVRYSYLDTGAPPPPDGLANRTGRLWQVADELGTTTLSYDARGQITGTVCSPRGAATSYALETTYDNLGRVASLVLPATAPGAARRRIDITIGPDGQVQSASGVVTAATYDLYGRSARLVYANGAVTELDFEPAGGPIARIRVLDAHGQVLRDVTGTRDNGLLGSIASATADDDPVQFAYDPLRRLAGATYRAAELHAWSFDDLYRLTSTTEAGALAYAPGTHQLASVGGRALAWDAAGRLAAAPYGKLAFDAEDRLARLTRADNSVVTHTYNYRGRLAASAQGGVQTYLSPLDDLEIHNGKPALWLRFCGLRVGAEVDGAVWFLHPNLLGAQDLITAPDGTLAGRLRRTPFGTVRPGGAAPTGAVALLTALLGGDDPTGLVRIGFRWYDPRLGQFISPDPIVSSAYALGAWNPYVYCLGNPVALADPTGAGFWEVLGMIGLAVVAAAATVSVVYAGVGILCGVGIISLATMDSVMTAGYIAATAIGAFGGALAGELAAQRAGGNILAGALLGGLLGGVAAFTGTALGVVIGGALGEAHWYSFVLTGATQGVLTGEATGLAVGFAGGAGSAEQIWKSLGLGAAWGAAFGVILSAGVWATLNVFGGSNYLQVLTFVNKYDIVKAEESGMFAAANTADNWLGLVNDIVVPPTRGGLNWSDAGTIFDFITPVNLKQAPNWFWDQGAVFNIPLGWIPSATFHGGFFSALINASMVADQAGFSYADQLGLLIKAAPCFIDFAYTLFTEADPDASDKVNQAFNRFFGSANPTS